MQEGSSALDLANFNDHWPVVELLMDAGASDDIPEEAAVEPVKSLVCQTAQFK